MPRQSYRPTNEELHKGLDNLHYEIQQLLELTRVASPIALLQNALVESRLLHVRTLVDFFEFEESRHDDILATHYGFALKPVQLSEPYKTRLNKDLAHLTYSRTQRTEATKTWPFDLVIAPVLERCLEFVEHVLSDRMVFSVIGPTHWRDLALRIRDLLASRP